MAKQNKKDLFSSGFAKLLKEKWHSDLLLKAMDTDRSSPIFAHRLVLAARSDVFKKMLEPYEINDSSGPVTVTLAEMRHEELETLVEFMYSCAGSVSSEKLKKHARSLYLAAEKYEILHLRDLCRNEFISSLNSSNALDLLELSQNPLDKALNDAVLAFVARNIRTIVDSGEFKLFVARNPNLAVEITKAFLNPITEPSYEDDSDDWSD